MGHKQNEPLLILMILSGLAYVLKVFNEDEIAKGRSKWYLLRRSIVGALGSAMFTWWTYEILKHNNFAESLCLATAGAVGYLGADVLARIVEKFVDRWADKI